MSKEVNLPQLEFELYELLRIAAQDDSILVKEEDWRRIETGIKVLWPNLGKEIYERGVYLTEIELRICWMTRLHIPPRGMAYILKRSKAAISLARARLDEKFKGEKGNGQMFDEFIRRL